MSSYYRELQAAHGISLAELLRHGASSDHKNLSDHVNGRTFPEPRCFFDLLDAFARAGTGLFHTEAIVINALYMQEAPAWKDRTRHPGRVSETRPRQMKRTTRSTRTSKSGEAQRSNKNGARGVDGEDRLGREDSNL